MLWFPKGLSFDQLKAIASSAAKMRKMTTKIMQETTQMIRSEHQFKSPMAWKMRGNEVEILRCVGLKLLLSHHFHMHP